MGVTSHWTGTGTALVTPFTEDLEVDLKALGDLVEFTIEGGIDYLVVLGTTGETATLDAPEKQAVIRRVSEVNAGRVPLMVGMGSNNTRALLREVQQTDFLDYQGILSVSPYYNRPTQEGIIAHFKALDAVTPLPIMVYNVPARTGSNMSVETTLTLATECPNIFAIKEACGDLSQLEALIRKAPEDFMVISGDDFTAVPTVALGGQGVVSVLAQGIPVAFTQMMQAGLAKDVPRAEALYAALDPLVRLIFREGNPAGIKALLNLQGVCESHVRMPLLPASKGLQDSLSDALAELRAKVVS